MRRCRPFFMIVGLVAIVALSACSTTSDLGKSNFGGDPEYDISGLIGDAASTALVLNAGGVELNPVLSGVGGGDPLAIAAASFVVAMGVEAAIKPAFENNPAFPPDSPRRALNTLKIGLTCSNLAVFAAGASFGDPLSLLGIVGCGAWKYYVDKKNSRYVRSSGPRHWVSRADL